MRKAHVWGRCIESQLAKCTPLFTSSTAPDPARGLQGVLQGATGFSWWPLLVSTAAEAPLQLTMAPDGQKGPSVSAIRWDLAPQPPLSSAPGLASMGPYPLLTGCAQSVRPTILNTRAPSTRAEYERKWRQFSMWCEGRTEGRVLCPVSTVAEFLQSLLDVGRAYSVLNTPPLPKILRVPV